MSEGAPGGSGRPHGFAGAVRAPKEGRLDAQETSDIRIGLHPLEELVEAGGAEMPPKRRMDSLLQEFQETSRRHDSDAFVLSEVQQVAVSAHEISGEAIRRGSEG